MIPVTKPFLPPLEDYKIYLEGVWKREWLTNMGPLASQLEMDLKDYLKVQHLLYVTNGTVALQMAIKALDLKGEIITTPFSFVATTSSIVWEGCTPVFVDIDRDSLNIDATQIEAAITDKTSAILATHVYGNPCDVVEIERIAKKHNLKVIYDAAHAFGVEIDGKSIFEFGDISTCSLHATKLYHSVEGGLVITTDPEILKKLASIRNFGISGHETFSELGLNGKNSEFHAAMGLCNLPNVPDIIAARKEIFDNYDSFLNWEILSKPKISPYIEYNYAYYPVVFPSEKVLRKVQEALAAEQIIPRRYFYPSLNTLAFMPKSMSCPVSEDMSERVLSLPLYVGLPLPDVERISKIINGHLSP